jgi:DNA-binding response OmpR family regulator
MRKTAQVARMRAVLRRVSGPAHRRLAVRDLDIDLAARVVRVGGDAVQLSAKEYELLVALAEDPERVFRKEELLRNVWGFRSLGRRMNTDPIPFGQVTAKTECKASASTAATGERGWRTVTSQARLRSF